MDVMKRLVLYLQENDPYPCMHLLEASLASRNYCTDEVIPETLIKSIQNGLGNSKVQNDISNLLELGVFEKVNKVQSQGVRLKEKMLPSMEHLIQQLRCSMTLEMGSCCIVASEYLGQLVNYLLSSEADVSIKENNDDYYLLESEGKIYRLLLTLSTFWLPLSMEKKTERESIIAFGPFASQSWDDMYPCYASKEFRSHVGLYDPWSRQKLCLCKGSLPVYIDWFFRDKYKRQFSIPPDFAEALHDMGLMRYNDER